MEIMFNVEFWHWWIMATVLLIFEILSATFFALWIAVSAAITGVALYLMPDISWQYQIILFALLSVVSTVAWRIYYSKNPITSDQPLLNRHGEQFIGRIFTLDSPIVNGHGKVKIGDSVWKVQGEDCPKGTKIKVVSINSVILKVTISS